MIPLPKAPSAYSPSDMTVTRNLIVAAISALQNTVSNLAKPQPVTFANLPAGQVKGQRAIITDGSVSTFLASAAGGGTVVMPVFWNGSAWKVG